MLKNYLLIISFIALVVSKCTIDDVCGDHSCCACMQDPNPTNGNGYQEFEATCLEGGINCIGFTGCQLCYKPVLEGVNVGNRPVCDRFTQSSACNSEVCCINRQNPNSNDGNSYLEFNTSCLDGGLNCVANTGCQLCYKPVLGGVMLEIDLYVQDFLILQYVIMNIAVSLEKIRIQRMEMVILNLTKTV